jgi:hypothetical protein
MQASQGIEIANQAPSRDCGILSVSTNVLDLAVLSVPSGATAI